MTALPLPVPFTGDVSVGAAGMFMTTGSTVKAHVGLHPLSPLLFRAMTDQVYVPAGRAVTGKDVLATQPEFPEAAVPLYSIKYSMASGTLFHANVKSMGTVPFSAGKDRVGGAGTSPDGCTAKLHVGLQSLSLDPFLAFTDQA